MQDNEYERLRRDLEEQLAADLDLIRAAHESKLRALEALRNASTASPDTSASVTQADSSETQTELRHQRGDLLTDVLKIFADLPETFDKSDLVRLLGYKPNRPSLHRVWEKLQADNRIVMELFGAGRRPARFRKVGAE